jgi:prepilin-type N-terminal cleavage/methylation domain-containing protein
MTTSSARRGFTLLELMVVVAIIGLLTTVAIPSFLRYQLRSRSGEALVNLAAIGTAQAVYFAEYGTVVGVASPVPATAPGNGRSVWTPGSNFDELGWAPEGGVQFQYQVVVDGGAPASARFTAEARGDVDADGQPSFWAFIKPGPGGGLNGAFPATTCVGSGVISLGAANAFEVPGPCDLNSGRSVF